MPDMHGTRWIGRDIFHIDAPPRANRAIAIGFTNAKQKRHLLRQIAFAQPQIDESRPRRFGGLNHRQRAELLHQRRGNLGRRQARGLGNHQGSIGRHIAMRCITRRFHLHARQDVSGQFRVKRHQRRAHLFRHGGENIFGHANLSLKYRGRSCAGVLPAQSGLSCRRYNRKPPARPGRNQPPPRERAKAAAAWPARHAAG